VKTIIVDVGQWGVAADKVERYLDRVDDLGICEVHFRDRTGTHFGYRAGNRLADFPGVIDEEATPPAPREPVIVEVPTTISRVHAQVQLENPAPAPEALRNTYAGDL
jgi:hypothetical protein